MSVVVSTNQYNDPLVLKLVPPWADHHLGEALALQAWQGHGAPRLRAWGDDGRVLLMQHILPGDSPPQPTPQQIADVLARLHHADIRNLPLPDMSAAVAWRFTRSYRQHQQRIPLQQLQSAHRQANQLITRPSRRQVLVHGDFLAKNTVCCQSGQLVALDPMPFIGDAEYDVALWAMAQLPTDEADWRAATVTDLLQLDHERVHAWMRVLLAAEAAIASMPRCQQLLDLIRRWQLPWLDV